MRNDGEAYNGLDAACIPSEFNFNQSSGASIKHWECVISTCTPLLNSAPLANCIHVPSCCNDSTWSELRILLT